MEIRDSPAAGNFMRGREGRGVERIIVHVSQGSMASMAAHFASPGSGVSAHYGISREGEVCRYVAEGDTAFHAGDWQVNLRSIGLEHEGVGADYCPTEAQLEASARLAAEICRRHGIVPSEGTLEPHRKYRNTRCPAGFPMEGYVERVRIEKSKIDN